MLKNFILLLILFFFGNCKSSEVSKGEKNDISACETQNFAFQDGEKLTYRLYYNAGSIWMPAGEVIFEVEDIGSQFHITAKGRTYESYERFFKVDDTYQVYLDKKTLLPLTSIREVHEGNYHLFDKVVFDQKNKRATSWRGKDKENISSSEINIDNCMHDLLSIIYFSRNIDFKNLTPNTYFPLSFFMDRKIHPLEIFYKGQENNTKIKGLGKFDTQVFSPQTIPGRTFKESTNIDIWVSNDENRVPLMIASPVSVGEVKAVLKSYKGLRNEFKH